jgi:hypothetical protein
MADWLTRARAHPVRGQGTAPPPVSSRQAVTDLQPDTADSGRRGGYRDRSIGRSVRVGRLASRAAPVRNRELPPRRQGFAARRTARRRRCTGSRAFLHCAVLPITAVGTLQTSSYSAPASSPTRFTWPLPEVTSTDCTAGSTAADICVPKLCSSAQTSPTSGGQDGRRWRTTSPTYSPKHSRSPRT